jgi:hypothetical protein
VSDSDKIHSVDMPLSGGVHRGSVREAVLRRVAAVVGVAGVAVTIIATLAELEIL